MKGAAVEQAWFLLGWGRCWRWKGLQPLEPECLWAWVSFPVALSSLIFLYHDFILWDPANTVFFFSLCKLSFLKLNFTVYVEKHWRPEYCLAGPTLILPPGAGDKSHEWPQGHIITTLHPPHALPWNPITMAIIFDFKFLSYIKI